MPRNSKLVLHPNLQLQIEDRPIPSIKPHEVLVNIRWTGICGSDLHLWTHGRMGPITITKPTGMGHESSGVVVLVGEQVKHLKKGDRVCVEPIFFCNNCSYCFKGQYSLCPDIFVDGCMDGGMCNTFLAHHSRFVHRLPDNISLEEGAMVEPLTVAVKSCTRAGVIAGKTILICGAGPIGILVMLCARAMGAYRICISDVRQARLDQARELGAEHVILVSEVKELKDQVKEELGDLAEVTIDCCGSEQTVPAAIQATKTGGVLVITGLHSEKATISLKDVTFKQLDIRGIFQFPGFFPTALRMLESGAANLGSLITHKFSQAQATEAFRLAADEASGAMKVILGTPDHQNL